MATTTAFAFPAAPASDKGLDAEDKITRSRLGLALIGWGFLGLLGSLALSIESYLKESNPSYEPLCSINPLISCSDSMTAWQGRLLGFQNAYLGTVLFLALIVLGFLVRRGVALPRWMWWGLGLGVFAGLAFVVFFAITSILVFKTLCPYCLVVWLATIPLFVIVTAALLQERLIGGPRTFWVKNRAIIIVVLLALLAVALVFGFADKWQYVF